MNKEIPKLYEKKENCCGCSACIAICPVGAIKMVMDNEGFYYPEIDSKKCIKCYSCLKVCALKN